MPKPEIPPGYALVAIADLVAPPGRSAAQPPRQAGSAWEGLAAAVAMVTARLGHYDVDLSQLADDTDPESIIRPLVIIAAAGLQGCLTEAGVEKLLRDFGEIAALCGNGPDGRKR